MHFANGTVRNISLTVTESEGKQFACLSRGTLNFQEVQYVDVAVDPQPICAGDSGFFLVPGGWWNSRHHDTAIGYFRPRADTEYINYDPQLYVLGIQHRDTGYLVLVSGMKEIAHHRIRVENGNYQFSYRFAVEEEPLYEDIRLEYHPLHGDLSYSAMGRAYRAYELANGFVSIRDRLNEDLAYAADSMCVRVRMGWKPVPCTILEQTLENEPPVHVACTFRQVAELMREYKKAGIRKAEFCLVGWNKSGHDGRWPQILPPEETMGRETELRELIQTARELGYTICAHTNSTDAYRIANNFSEDILARKKDGSFSIEAEMWGGGRTYNICPEKSYETFPPVTELGFRGTHYIDVITATPPRSCYHPEHPVNRQEACRCFDRLFDYTRGLFGTVGCEVGMEHSMKKCDFILYASMNNGLNPAIQDENLDLFAEYVPFWHIVFHGIILSNPYGGTVNAILNRNPDALLKLIELGGRPVVYYYSQFKSDGTNWMGDQDFRMGTEAELQSGVEAAKATDRLNQTLSYLQYEFMDSHEKLDDHRYRTTYSDGSVITAPGRFSGVFRFCEIPVEIGR